MNTTNVPTSSSETCQRAPSNVTPWRLRGDLEVVARQTQGRRERWLADPISGRVVRFDEADYQRLRAMESNPSATELDPQVSSLINETAALGLLRDAGHRALSRRRPWWTNPLYIRCHGMPADQIASRLGHLTPWLFSRRAVILWCCVFAATGAGLISRHEMLWPSLQALPDFQARHWMLALLSLGLTKVVHELAHAAVCRRMGARCREIGVLLLCGTPCLYCDVSDSWRIGPRRGRIAVMLAGVYVEWILATAAAWIWISAEPSTHRMLAFHIMLLCGASTFIVNLNPLMRYDGYYVLSDILNTTNLRQRASEMWQSNVVKRVAGSGYEAPHTRGSRLSRFGFSAYFLSSLAYRYVVMIAIGGWLYSVATRAGLEPVGRAALILAAVMVAASLVRRWAALIQGRGAWVRVPGVRRGLIACALAATAIAVLLVPVQRRIQVAGHVDLANSATVYLPLTATVRDVHVEYGRVVRAGDPLAALASTELDRRHQRNLAEGRQAELRYQDLIKQSLRHPQVQEEIDSYRTALEATKAQSEITARMRETLALVAPSDGVIMREASPAHSERGEDSSALNSLAHRVGASLQKGSAWCRIGEVRQKQVLLEVDAAERRYVSVGDRVRISIDQSSGAVIECPIRSISSVRHDKVVDVATQNPDRFIVACELPERVAEKTVVGATAVGVFRGSSVRLWDLIVAQGTGRY